jgi:hypothetical protein
VVRGTYSVESKEVLSKGVTFKSKSKE